jgi:hypothetical protein
MERAGGQPKVSKVLGGIRFEDLLPVTDGGCETLTQYPSNFEPPPLRCSVR